MVLNVTRLLLSLVVLVGVTLQGAAASMTAGVATAGSIQAGGRAGVTPPLLVPQVGDIDVGKFAPDPRRGVALEIPVAGGVLAGGQYPLALRVVGFFLGAMLAVAAHEVGHLVCAIAASIAVRRVSIGVGPLLLRRRIGETWFELRLVAAAGFVSIYPLSVIRKFRQALFILGGVLANALVLAVVAAIGLVGAFPARLAEWGDLMGPIVFMQAYMIMANLTPFVVKIQGSRLPSDGLQLLQLWSAPRGATALGLGYVELTRPFCAGSGSVPNSPVWSRIMYNLSNAQRWTDPEARREIHESLIRELARGALPTEAEGLVLDGLITDGLVFSEPLLRSRLDAWSLRAIEIAPDVKTLRGSRGAVLVELGRYQEGRDVLEALVTETGLKPFDYFMSNIYLAHAALALGDVDSAQYWVAAASSIELAEFVQPFAAEMIARFTARRDGASAGQRLAV